MTVKSESDLLQHPQSQGSSPALLLLFGLFGEQSSSCFSITLLFLCLLGKRGTFSVTADHLHQVKQRNTKRTLTFSH